MAIRVSVQFVVVSALLMTALAGGQDDEQSKVPNEVGASAIALMSAPDGSSMGQVTLTQGPHGILLSADLSGLSPGWHGFHIHQTGSCSPDFSAAGGHHAVEGQGHGFMHGEFHSGDMPNIYAAPDGTARADVFNLRAVFDTDAANSIFDADGSAIIVHAKPDSYGEDAGAGDRISCGAIARN